MSSRNHVIMQVSTDVISKFVMQSVHNWRLHWSISELSMKRRNQRANVDDEVIDGPNLGDRGGGGPGPKSESH